MHSTICFGCQAEILNTDSKKTFEDNLLVDCIEADNTASSVVSKKNIKLYSAIEIITGRKVNGTGKLARDFCKICFDKLQTLLNFRTQLLLSIDKSCNPIRNDGNTDIAPTSNYKNTDIVLYESEESKIKKDAYRNLESHIVSDDVINVDEVSMPSFNTLQSEEFETNDSTGSNKLQNDQDNNNLNDSDNSSSFDDHEYTDVFLKIEKNDIESDIDVCSGEDDEVLELDVLNKNDEPVEISSSSESDIEVCDYEPSGKRLKDYHAVSLPVRF